METIRERSIAHIHFPAWWNFLYLSSSLPIIHHNSLLENNLIHFIFIPLNTEELKNKIALKKWMEMIFISFSTVVKLSGIVWKRILEYERKSSHQTRVNCIAILSSSSNYQLELDWWISNLINRKFHSTFFYKLQVHIQIIITMMHPSIHG